MAEQQLTYGDETESFRLDINTKQRRITFSAPVFGFLIYAEGVAVRYEINGDIVANSSMVLQATGRDTRHVLTTTIAVQSTAGDGAVYVSGHR